MKVLEPQTGVPAPKLRGYANATAVLPAALLAQLQQHYTGLLWIPAPNPPAACRRDLVESLYRQGISAQRIALLAGVTPRRVRQIMAAHQLKASD